MNQNQKDFLAQHGVATVNDLTDPLRRLEYTEIDPAPDPAPIETETETEAQRQFLCGQSFDDLSDFSKEIYLKMGASKAVTDVGTAAPARPGPPRLDPKKLEGLTPLRRSQLFEHVQVLEQNHREAMAGIAPHLRDSRWEVEAARLQTAPYLVD
ncbi:hypothetical protein EN814_09750 [Mesorhizobium sp. M2D.F.Ca.ET.171.01.1.1]|uniref:hypothetical protein n=1 Tax=unclassified Mesorhizobium TaxID=325217 RepID=UPI001092EC32|nr:MULTISPECIES: hypothetical protein [unclassified Mesorhizobium]TGS97467.1 hypothetical protein EN821_09745 [Mesorhizobium sp. M2D.F.Ca.ET.178.01.1.1]TGT12038.1 hypothetical protein EN814_09750 [Mesorhizobium sp. M2D.F.Ca.ET.171.01.1.1]